MLLVMSRTLLVANPSCDVYGADLQMLESVAAVLERGWRVVLASPSEGPLREKLEALGAEVRVVDYPVLRRADASAGGVARLGAQATKALPRMRRLVKELGPDVIYVNTVTLPWWLAVAKSQRVPTLCHVHEAEPDETGLVRKAMALPLRLSTAIAVNSRTSLEAMCAVAPKLRDRTTLVYNGVEPPTTEPTLSKHKPPTRLVAVGRLSPRKGPDVALEATALLRTAGYDVELELCGTPVPDQQWFADQLHARAGQPDLDGAVIWTGYASPIWTALDRADIFVAPARAEPFGNAVIEGQLARLPVVATAQQGHLETVIDDVTGLHVPVESAQAIADAVARLIDDPALADRLADAGRARALEEFTAERYRRDIADLLEKLA